MKLAEVDFWANHGSSALHKASPAAKLAALGLVFVAVMLTDHPFITLAIYAGLVIAAAGTGLPLKRLVLLGAYPALFAVLYAWASYRGSWLGPGLILGKTLSLSMAAVLNIATTPYPEILRRLTRFLPPVLGDVVLLTYRSVFILLELAEELGRVLRLRGGLARGRILANLRNLAGVLGILLIRAIDQSQRVHSVMRLRGYAGRLVDERESGFVWRRDLGPVLFGGLSLGIAALARYDSRLGLAGVIGWSLGLLAPLTLFSLRSRSNWRKLSR